MIKKILLLFGICLFASSLSAQLVQPCPSNSQPPADNCGECIYCGFNGLQSTTQGYNASSAPGFCSGIQNNQWIGFIAGETSATFSAIPTFCQNGDGVQLALYDGSCNSMLACDPGGPGLGTVPATISTSAMVPGQTYYFMIDGYSMDECTFTIAVSPNSAISPPFPPAPDSISGPSQVCPGITTQHCVPPVDGGSAITWTAPAGALINGAPGPVTILTPAGLCVNITWPNTPTAGPILANAINSCYNNTPPAVQVVTSLEEPPTIEQFPPVCLEDFPVNLPWGGSAPAPGSYDHTYSIGAGCDSLVTHIYTPIFVPPTIALENICAGETINYCGTNFNQAGSYDAICTNADGCDSIIKLTIVVIPMDPNIQGGGMIDCNNPSLVLKKAPGASIPTWSLNGNTIGFLDSITVTQPGIYVLQSASPVSFNTGCVLYDTIVITGNITPPTANPNGSVIGCGGSAEISVVTDAANPAYAWAPGVTPANQAVGTVSSPGLYTVTVTNLANGCTKIGVAEVMGSVDIPTVAVAGNNLNCSIQSSTITATTPIPNPIYQWSTGDSIASITTTTPGTYTVTVTNPDNKCTNSQSYVVLSNTTQPNIQASVRDTLTCVTLAAPINVTSDSSNLTYLWSNGETAEDISVALGGTYTVTATASNGCKDTTAVTVQTNKMPPGVILDNGGGVLTCLKKSVALTAASNTSDVSYSWGGSTTGSVFQVSAPGTYSVEATGPNGCTSTEMTIVSEDIDPPMATAVGGTIDCSSDSIQIMGSSSTGNVSYAWQGPNGGTFLSQNPFVKEKGIYTLIVTNLTNGCSTSQTTTVNASADIPDATIAMAPDLDCTNTSVALTGSTNIASPTMSWLAPNGVTTTGNTLTVTQPGDYTLTVLDQANGCKGTAITTVSQNLDAPVYQLFPEKLSCTDPTKEIQLVWDASSTPIASYAWSGPSVANPTDQNATVSQPGQYTVVVTGTNGCVSTQTTTVTADQNIPVAVATADQVLTCSKTSVPIQLNIISTSQILTTTWTGPNFTSSDEDPIVSEGGSYTVQVTTNSGCRSEATVMVSQDTIAPDLMLPPKVIGCAAPSVNLEAISAAAIKYEWTGPTNFSSTSPSPVVSENGTYEVTVSAQNGCSTIGSLMVTTDFDTAAIAIANPLPLTCLVQTVGLDATITTSPTLPVGSFSWSSNTGYTNTSDEDPADILLPGTYILTVETINGCLASKSVVVNQDIAVPNAIANGVTLTCAAPQQQLMAQSDTLGVSYIWTDPNGMIINEQNPLVNITGIYNLKVVGANGCPNNKMAEVKIDTLSPQYVNILAAETTITCATLEVGLAAETSTTNVDYAWANGANTLGTDSTLLVNAPGSYVIAVTSADNGCVTTQEILIDIDKVLPDAEATGAVTDCNSGFANLVGNSTVSGAEYTWESPSLIKILGQTINVSEIGLYTLTVLNPTNGCENTDTTLLLSNQDAPVIAVNAPLTVLDCNNPDITLTGSITSPANPTFQWLINGIQVAVTQDFTVNTAGNYLFEVSDPNNGCKTTMPVNITDDFSTPGVETRDSIINCFNPTITVSANSPTAGVSYVWTNPDGTTFIGSDISISSSGNFSVEATGTNGCKSTDIALISEDFVKPALDISTETITCLLPEVILNSTSQVTTLTYAWTGQTALPSIEDPSTTVAGTYQLEVTNTVNGCTEIATIEVLENTVLPDVTTMDNTLPCNALSVPIGANSTIPNVTYAWFINGGQISTEQNPEVTEAGTYTVEVTDPVNGCMNQATATVLPDVNAPIAAAEGGLINCANPSTTLLGSSSTSNVGFEWTGPNGFVSQDANPTVSEAGTYTLTVNSIDNGCTTVKTAVVTSNFVEPTIAIAPTDLIDCNNASVIISSSATGQGTISYDWTAVTGIIHSGANSQNPEVGAGTFTLEVTDSHNGCMHSEDVSIEADPATPSGVNSTLRSISCYGETDGAVTLQGVTGGTPPFLYSFDNQAFVAQTQWTNLEPGVYNLTIQDALGCEFATSFNIIEPNELMLDLGPDLVSANAGANQYLFLGDSVALYDDLSINYPDRILDFIVEPVSMYPFICDTCDGNYFKAFYTQRYKVTVVDSNGCKAVDDRLIVVDRTRNVYVPNIFNPDATDGANHLLTVFGNEKHVSRIISFKLFDRWGEAVHEALDFAPNTTDKAWDGRFRNKRVLPGVYIWAADVEFIDGVIELYSGDVTVIGN